MRIKVPPEWTLKNLRQMFLTKLKVKVETGEYDYEEWEYP